MRGLYIHIPFCNNKCPYCSFYSVEDYNRDIVPIYLETVLKECKEIKNKVFDTIYIGGGTPSSIKTELLKDFIDEILSTITYNGAEFTIEANPESVSDKFLDLVKTSSISRVSLGVQSFNDDVLKLLGRIHSSDKAYNVAKSLKHTSKDLNLDMIYDIPTINESIFIDTLNKIIEIEPTHISAYAYDAEDTGYLKGLFNEDLTQFEYISKICKDNGYYKYEVSNFAKLGKESIHNSLYWQAQEYIGLGSSAHSMIEEDGKRIRYSHSSDISSYLKDYKERDLIEVLDKEDSLIEDIIFGLRMVKGINLNFLQEKYGNFNDKLNEKINFLIDQKLLERNGTCLKTTLEGMLKLESLSCHLLPE